MAKNQGLIGYVKDFYNDPFKWSLVKSFGFFVVGVAIANELTGLEPMSAVPQ